MQKCCSSVTCSLIATMQMQAAKQTAIVVLAMLCGVPLARQKQEGTWGHLLKLQAGLAVLPVLRVVVHAVVALLGIDGHGLLAATWRSARPRTYLLQEAPPASCTGPESRVEREMDHHQI